MAEPQRRGEDSRVILLRAGAAIGSVSSMAAYGHGPPGTDKLDILGARGRIWLQSATARLDADEPERFTVRPEEAYQQSYDATIAHFVHALRTGTTFETYPAVHLAALELVERIFAATAAR